LGALVVTTVISYTLIVPLLSFWGLAVGIGQGLLIFGTIFAHLITSCTDPIDSAVLGHSPNDSFPLYCEICQVCHTLLKAASTLHRMALRPHMVLQGSFGRIHSHVVNSRTCSNTCAAAALCAELSECYQQAL
jgi:hypothetical protein